MGNQTLNGPSMLTALTDKYTEENINESSMVNT